MARLTSEQTIEALIALSGSDTPLIPAPIDDIVDAYLVGFGGATSTKRDELARHFLVQTRRSPRADFLYRRILKRIP